MAAAALEYPRRRMLVVVGVSRVVRFTVAGVLGALFGRQVLRWAANDVVQGLLLALVILCVIGSVVSVYGWVKRSRIPQAAGARS